jgi:hypothetical protein
MGLLKPGATYIYERADGVTYAREAGAHPGDRIAIGWDYDYRTKTEAVERMRLWTAILASAKTNPALQEAVDRVIVVYELSKQDPNDDPPDWHPV